ncbi:MAG: hypothetical protein U0821_11040 [Chloroflexota bacterium]
MATMGISDAMGTAAIRPGVGEPRALVDELQGWQLSKEQARRCNRNLLQYAAGLTAILGINVGGGGMLAIAKALGEVTQEDGDLIFGLLTLSSLVSWIVLVAACGGGMLLILLVKSFLQRQASEHRADEHMRRLIVLAPDWFHPKEE